MWVSATRRKEKKEMKEKRKGSRIFLFSKKVFFGKVGLAARIKRGERHQKQRRRDRKEGGFFRGDFQNTQRKGGGRDSSWRGELEKRSGLYFFRKVLR